jgi:hypothetical protein
MSELKIIKKKMAHMKELQHFQCEYTVNAIGCGWIEAILEKLLPPSSSLGFGLTRTVNGVHSMNAGNVHNRYACEWSVGSGIANTAATLVIEVNLQSECCK